MNTPLTPEEIRERKPFSVREIEGKRREWYEVYEGEELLYSFHRTNKRLLERWRFLVLAANAHIEASKETKQ